MIYNPGTNKAKPAAQSPSDAPVSVREEVCALGTARRICAMLDLAPESVVRGQALPRGWHFPLLAADTARSALRGDGFPGLGVAMPDLGLPRLMLGGRSVHIVEDIPVGAEVLRRSHVSGIVHKPTASGTMAFVTVSHALEIQSASKPALVETQTYVLMRADARKPASTLEPGTSPVAMHRKTVTADETLLFQYSALGFNSHRIHLDREHAQEVEGFPDLVVNGGLSTLLLTEFLRNDLGIRAQAWTVRHLAPLFCDRPITLTADPVEHGWHLKAFDEQHRLAVDMQVEAP